MKLFVSCLLWLLNSNVRATSSSSGDPVKMNNIRAFYFQVAPLSRIANAIYLQKSLIEKPAEADRILAELVNLANLEMLSDVEKIDIEPIDFLLHSLESLPEFPMEHFEDVSVGLTALNVLKDVDTSIGDQIDSGTLATFFADLGGCISFLKRDLKAAKEKFANTTVLVEQVRSKADPVATNENEWMDLIKNLQEAFKKSGTVYRKWDSLKAGSCEKAVNNLPSIAPLVQRSRLSDELTTKIGLIYQMESAMASIRGDLTILQNFINDPSDSALTSLKNLQTFVKNLGAPTRTIGRRFTRAFPEGVIDLSRVDDDLESTWMRDKIFGGKSIEPLKSALLPMSRLQGTVRKLESHLHAIRTRGGEEEGLEVLQQVLNNVTEIKNLGDLEASTTKLEELLADVKKLVRDSSGIADLYEKLEGSKKLATDLGEAFEILRGSDGWEAMGAMGQLKDRLQKTGNETVATMVARIKADPEFTQLPSDFVKIPGMEDFVSHSDALKAKELSLTKEKSAERWSKNEFPKLLEFLNNVKTHESHLTTLGAQVAFARLWNTVKQDLPLISKTILDTSEDVKMISHHLSASREAASKMTELAKKNAVVNAVVKFADGRKVSETLGKACDLVKHLSFSLNKSNELKTVIENSEVIGTEIENVKDPDRKSEIEKGWSDSKKIKEALEALLADVTRLEKEIPATGASDVAGVGSIVAKLNTVKDPGLNVKEIQMAVHLLNVEVSNSNPKVRDTNLALFYFGDVQLEFAAWLAAPEDVTASTAALSIFEEFQKEASGAAAAQVAELAGREAQWYQYAILVVIFIATVATPGFVIFSSVTKHNREKYGAAAIIRKFKKEKATADQGVSVSMSTNPSTSKSEDMNTVPVIRSMEKSTPTKSTHV